MTERLQITAVVATGAFLIVIIELIRRRRLREKYALLWLLAGALFLAMALDVELWAGAARFLGFAVPANALFFAGLLVILVLLLGMTIAISTLAGRTERLTQELALIERRLPESERKILSGP